MSKPKIFQEIDRLDEKIDDNISGRTITTPKIFCSETARPGAEVPIRLLSTSALIGGKISSFTYTFNGETKEVDAMNDSVNISVIIPEDSEVGDSFDLTVVAHDNFTGNSLPTTRTIRVVGLGILAPTLILPPTGTAVGEAGNIIFVASPFTLEESFTDTHVSTDWQIASDPDFEDVVASVTSSEHLTSYEFTGLTLNLSKRYYGRVKYNGNIATSMWSVANTFILTTYGLAKVGRSLIRHSSGMGTVINFVADKTTRLLVLDAKYRTHAKFGTYGTDVPELDNITSQNTSSNWGIYTTPSSSQKPSNHHTYTDRQINDKWSGKYDTKTSKENCDAWLLYDDITDTRGIVGVPAVRAARSILVGGKPCDVPNIQCMMRIYCDAVRLDALDPTVGDYSGNAFIDNYNNREWYVSGISVALTSTEYNASTVRCISDSSSAGSTSKDTNCAVIPVLELPITKEEPYISITGRQLWRHSSGMGTVLCYDSLKGPKKYLILDAKYRTKAAFGLYYIDSSAPSATNDNTKGTQYLDGGDAAMTVEKVEVMSDVDINTLWPSLKVDQSVQDICSSLLAYENYVHPSYKNIIGVPAVSHARSILVDGVGCDIPDIETVIRLYCEAVAIDGLDPTISEFSRYKLNPWANNILSCVEQKSSEAHHILTFYYHDNSNRGKIYIESKTSTGLVVPVLEITD